jgi:hypothetical protein
VNYLAFLPTSFPPSDLVNSFCFLSLLSQLGG